MNTSPIGPDLQLTSERERELRVEAVAAKEQLEQTLGRISDLFMTLDRDWQYTYVNDKAVEIFGKQRDELLGQVIWDVFPELVGEELYNEYHRAMEEQTPVQFEHYHASLDRWFERRVYPSREGLTVFAVDITERKRAEEALRASEHRFARFMEHLPGLAWIKDLEGRYVYANAAAERAFSTPRAELYGKTDEEVFPPETATQFKENDQRALANGRGVLTVEALEHEDGILHYSIVSKFPLPGSDGQVALVGGMAVDITEHKRAEEALRESEERERARAEEIEALMEAVPAVIFIAHDPECRVITGSRVAREFLRMPMDTNLSKTAPAGQQPTHFKVFKDGVEIEPHDLPVQLAARGVVVRDFEEEVVFDDGRRLRLYGNAEPLYDREGKVRGAISAFVDITERKRAEEALRQAMEKLQLITDVMAAPVTRCSRDLKYQWVSKPYADWLGLSPGEIVGRPIVDVLGQEAFESIRPYFERALSGEMVRYEEQVNFRGIGPRWISAIYTPTFDSTGTPDGWVAMVIDIDERRKAEDALKEADRRKDEFLAMLAHELRNPLAPIRNAVQALRRFGSPDPQLQWVRDVIDRQAEHLARLVDDLLDVSRITQGKIALRKERLELMAVIARALETSRPNIDARKHHLNVSLPQEPIRLEGDLIRLAQVVSNLLNNAAKFTEEGGQIWLTAESREGEIVLRVRDNGVGIPADLLPRIFDLFTQADRSLDRSQGGLGIGLSLVRSIVEMHGGRVEAASAGLGRGSEFTVLLPLLTEADAQTGSEPATRAGSAATPRRYRILVVDDNVDSAESMALLLKFSGHEVQMAHNGPSAIETALLFLPQVLLLDIGLPGMNGYEVARRLRERPEMQNAALLALTGYGQEEDRRRSKEAGFDHHLVKPVDPKLLETLIGSLVLD
jgi:PAS domain S-box-containing protein